MASGKNASAISGGLSGATTGATIGGPWGAAIGGGLGLAAGYLGGQDDNSDKYYEEMLARLSGINVPTADQLQFTPEELQYLGNLSPDQLTALNLDPSALENIQVDSRLKQEQMKALDKVSQLADQGFSDEDMMAFNIARQQAAGEAEAKQGQILQNMQQRGQGGSGAELITRLQSAQDSANQLSLEQQKQAIAQAEARKQALTMLANQSGSMRNQDFGEQSEIAKAKDTVKQINFQNQQRVQDSNVNNSNVAKARNLDTQQNISNQNVGIRNTGQQNNAQALKDIFGMQVAKATGQNQVSGQQAANSSRQAGNTNAGIGQIGQGLIQAAPGIKNMFNSNKPDDPTVNALKDPWNEDDTMTNVVNQGSYMGRQS